MTFSRKLTDYHCLTLQSSFRRLDGKAQFHLRRGFHFSAREKRCAFITNKLYRRGFLDVLKTGPEVRHTALTMSDTVNISRAPVLTLWAAVVAEQPGFDRAASLTLGQAVAGKSAYVKGVTLGIIELKPELVRERAKQLGEGEQLFVGLLGKPAGCGDSRWAKRRGQGQSGNPARIEKYLAAKFDDRLDGWVPRYS